MLLKISKGNLIGVLGLMIGLVGLLQGFGYLDFLKSGEVVSADDFAVAALHHGHQSGSYLRSQQLDKGIQNNQKFVDFKIWYEPNHLAKLLEGHENWSHIRFRLVNSDNNMILPVIIEEEEDTTVPWKQTKFQSEAMAKYIKGL